MLKFSAAIFDGWQKDYDDFNYAFRKFCFMQFRAFGVHADFIPNVMRQVHEQWCADCERWLAEETPPQTEKLSYLKRSALLLHSLVSLPFLGQMSEHEYTDDEIYSFRGTSEQYLSARMDLIDARDSVLSLDFVINIIHYFELNRIDRTERYRIPLTVDMRHDLIGYLLSDHVNAKSLYLILKALFLRHSIGGANN